MEECEDDPADFRQEIGGGDYGSKVTPGKPSWEESEDQVSSGGGTVGFIGFLRNDDSGSRHVLATVGHVMDVTDEDTVDIKTDANGLFELSHTVVSTPTELMPSSKRGYYDQPQSRQGQPARKCMDEICLIDAHGLPHNQLQLLHHSDPIDCNALCSLAEDDDLQPPPSQCRRSIKLTSTL